MYINYRSLQNLSDIVKKLKGRSSRRLQQEFPKFNKRYWRRHVWAIRFGCWSSGNITDKMMNEYLEHHRKSNDTDDSNFIIEWSKQGPAHHYAIGVGHIADSIEKYAQ